MAHEILNRNGRDSFAFNSLNAEKPWHGLGQALNGLATAKEIAAAAGMDFKVGKTPVYIEDGKGGFKAVKDAFMPIREEDRTPLGSRSVGPVFQPLQFGERFSFFDAVVGEKAAIYDAAGVLGNGERVFILAKLPGSVRVIGDDVVNKYLLLSDRNDGQGSLEIQYTPIRVVCANTLAMALRETDEGSRRQKARHTRTIGLRVSALAEGLGIVHKMYEAWGEEARALVKAPCDDNTFRGILTASGLVPAVKEGEAASTRALGIIEAASALFESGLGADIPGVRGTLWGAVNAVGEYVDHHRNSRGGGSDGRKASALWGSGAGIKAAAWGAALSLL